MAQGDTPPPFDDFDARLKKMRPAGERSAAGSPSDGDGASASRRMSLGPGFQAGVEVLGGVLGGVLIGYGLDAWLSTSPALLIVFFMLGAAAGVLNAYRTLRRFMVSDADQDRPGPK